MVALRTALLLASSWLIFGCAKSPANVSDDCSLLQISEGPKLYEQARSRRDGGLNPDRAVSTKCMKFMHIPKTGGTSIDSWGMHKDPPIFDSLMRQTFQRIATSMGPATFQYEYNSSLGNMYEKSHSNMSHYNMFVLGTSGNYKWLSQLDLGFCEDLHTPPFLDPSIESWYREGQCDVFCTVRDPFMRFLSAYQMNSIGLCDPKGFEEELHKLLPWLKKHPSQSACTFIPQVQFVYGAPSKELATKQYCNRIIHTEDMDVEFPAMMKDLGKHNTPKLPHLFTAKDMDSQCKIDPSKVTKKARQLIYDHFKADFEAFGYPFPSSALGRFVSALTSLTILFTIAAW